MKLIKAVILILLMAKISMAQTDSMAPTNVKMYETMSFFYIDNSSNGTASGLNKEVKNYLKLKMNEQENVKGNYVCTYTVDGVNSTLYDNVTKNVSFDHLVEYLKKGSAAADYARDNDTLKANFMHNNPVGVNTELSFFIFLSPKAVDKMIKEMNDMPTPISFPYQLATFTTHEKVLHPVIYLVTNKEVSKKYTDAQILRCFTFYKDKAQDVDLLDPIIWFK